MKALLFAKSQDLLQQRRLERGLPADPTPIPSATKLMLQGGFLGSLCIGVALGAWLLAVLRHATVRSELAGLQEVPAMLNRLEKEIPVEKAKVKSIESANNSLAAGLVAASSGSALLTQLSAITPLGMQLTEVNVQDDSRSLNLKGLAVDPMAFRKVNALMLLLGRSSLFDSSSVAIVKMIRDDKNAPSSRGGQVPSLPPLGWEMSLKLAKLPPTVLLQLLKGLDADGMAQRLILLQRVGVI